MGEKHIDFSMVFKEELNCAAFFQQMIAFKEILSYNYT
jgi:hypothetical protein